MTERFKLDAVEKHEFGNADKFIDNSLACSAGYESTV